MHLPQAADTVFTVPNHELACHHAGVTRERDEGVVGQDGSYPTNLGTTYPTGEF